MDYAAGKEGAETPSKEDFDNIGITGVDSDEEAAKVAEVLKAKAKVDPESVDSVEEVQKVATSYIKVQDYANGVEGATAPSKEDFENLGVTGIDSDEEAAKVAEVLKAKAKVDPESVDSVEEVQKVATSYAKVQDYANGVEGAIAPSKEDFENLGVLAIENDEEASKIAEVLKVKAKVDPESVDSVEEVQKVATSYIKVQDYANGVESATVPSKEDFENLGVTGVDSDEEAVILGDILKAKAKVDPESIDSVDEIVAVLVSYDKIQNYAKGVEGATVPTKEDFANIGVTGVDSDEEAKLLEDILKAKASKDALSIDTLAEIQATASSHESILAYADKVENAPAPTAQDYANAGITLLSADDVDDINEIIQDLGSEKVDSIDELQGVVSTYSGMIQLFTAESDVDVTKYISAENFETLGIEGVTSDNVAYIAQILRDKKADSIKDIKDTVSSYLKVMDYAAGKEGADTPSKEDFDNISITGVDSDEEAAEITKILKELQEDGTTIDNSDKVQAIVEAFDKIKAYAKGATTTPTVEDYNTLGIKVTDETVEAANTRVKEVENASTLESYDVLKELIGTPEVALADAATLEEIAGSATIATVKDLDGSTLFVDENATVAAGGVVSIDENGTITYTPNAGFTGEDTITLVVKDSDGYSVTKEITLNVLGEAEKDVDVLEEETIKAFPKITELSNGNYVIAWSENSETTVGYDLFLQVFDKDHNKIGDKILINDGLTKRDQKSVSLTTTKDGGFVAVFQSNNSGDFDIYMKKFDADGTPLTDNLLIKGGSEAQEIPTVVELPNRNLVITYAVKVDNDDFDIQVVGLSSDLKTELFEKTLNAANIAPALNYHPIVAVGRDRFTVAFDSYYSIDGESKLHVFAKQFDFNGNDLSDYVRLNTTAAKYPNTIKIKTLKTGNMIVTWNSEASAENGYVDISAQLVDKDLNKIGTEFVVNTLRAGGELFQDVTVNPSGGFTVAWQDSKLDKEEYGIGLQRFDDEGKKIGPESIVNSIERGRQFNVAIKAFSDGTIGATWVHDIAIDEDTRASVIKQKFLNKLFGVDLNEIINKIKTYAEDQTQAAPTELDYKLLEVTLYGPIDKYKLPAANYAIANKSAADVDTKDKIQDVMDEALRKLTSALTKARKYAAGTSEEPLTLEDLQNFGIELVPGALDVINKRIADLGGNGSRIDTIKEMNLLITSVNNAYSKIYAYVQDPENNEAPTLKDYQALAIDDLTPERVELANEKLAEVKADDIVQAVDMMLFIQDVVSGKPELVKYSPNETISLAQSSVLAEFDRDIVIDDNNVSNLTVVLGDTNETVVTWSIESSNPFMTKNPNGVVFLWSDGTNTKSGHFVYGKTHTVTLEKGSIKGENGEQFEGATWTFDVQEDAGPCGCADFDNCDLPENLQ
jgi:hypothetical protein